MTEAKVEDKWWEKEHRAEYESDAAIFNHLCQFEHKDDKPYRVEK